MYLHHMAEKVAARLRKHQLEAQTYFIGVRIKDGWITQKIQAHIATNDGQQIKRLVNTFLRNIWQGQGCSQVQITALDPNCLLYTSPSPRDVEESRMPSSA